MNRREFLQAASAAIALTKSLSTPSESPAAPPRVASVPSTLPTKTYTHRVQFGCWINDMRNDVLPRDNWPAKVLDDKTERDIIDCLTLGQQSGYNQIDVWGLFATSAYPIDLRSAFRDEQRRPRVDRI